MSKKDLVFIANKSFEWYWNHGLVIPRFIKFYEKTFMDNEHSKMG